MTAPLRCPFCGRGSADAPLLVVFGAVEGVALCSPCWLAAGRALADRLGAPLTGVVLAVRLHHVAREEVRLAALVRVGSPRAAGGGTVGDGGDGG